MYNGHCINPYVFFKTKSAFKVFTHVQLSGSTLQKQGMNDNTDVELQMQPLSSAFMPTPSEEITQLSHYYNTFSHPTFYGHEREFKKSNVVH